MGQELCTKNSVRVFQEFLINICREPRDGRSSCGIHRTMMQTNFRLIYNINTDTASEIIPYVL